MGSNVVNGRNPETTKTWLKYVQTASYYWTSPDKDMVIEFRGFAKDKSDWNGWIRTRSSQWERSAKKKSYGKKVCKSYAWSGMKPVLCDDLIILCYTWLLPNQLGTPVLKHPIGSDPLIATHDLCNGRDHGLFWSVSWCRERREVSYHTHYLILRIREHQNFLKTVVLPTTISKSPQSWHLILTRVLEIFLRYPQSPTGTL